MNNLVAELIGDYEDLEVTPEYVESLGGFSFFRGVVPLFVIIYLEDFKSWKFVVNPTLGTESCPLFGFETMDILTKELVNLNSKFPNGVKGVVK